MNPLQNVSERGPHHIAIIMDGNGRWAKRHGKSRSAGHRAGGDAVRRTTEAAVRLGLEQLTLFAFSTENWRRPQREVKLLMRLFAGFLRSERPTLIKNGVHLAVIGRTDDLPIAVQEELRHTIHDTRRGRNMTLCLAINYGARNELTHACRRIAREVQAGCLMPEFIHEGILDAHLYQPDMPPLDLIIRTGGNYRLSNFLLWQAAYAELYFTHTFWPDFGEGHLMQAIAAFQHRERRFGGLARSARLT